MYVPVDIDGKLTGLRQVGCADRGNEGLPKRMAINKLGRGGRK